MRRSRTSLRYYVWDGLKLWRFPHRLHTAVVNGESKLRRYANTRCKIIEVVVSREHAQPVITGVRGVIYVFDAEGELDLTDVGEAVEMMTQGTRPRHIQENVIDAGPVLRGRRWSAVHTWQPTIEMLRSIKADLAAKDIPALKV